MILPLKIVEMFGAVEGKLFRAFNISADTNLPPDPKWEDHGHIQLSIHARGENLDQAKDELIAKIRTLRDSLTEALNKLTVHASAPVLKHEIESTAVVSGSFESYRYELHIGRDYPPFYLKFMGEGRSNSHARLELLEVLKSNRAYGYEIDRAIRGVNNLIEGRDYEYVPSVAD